MRQKWVISNFPDEAQDGDAVDYIVIDEYPLADLQSEETRMHY